ncbi:MAG: UvrD-helicase domain-containing protein, partial [Acidimicrobiales bacterium]
MGCPGPAELSRSVVVAAGQAAPDGWRQAARVEIDEGALADPGSTVRRLHQAWAEREPIIASLGVDPARFRTPPSYPVEPWTLAPDFELWEDRLQFLVWANAYDARRHPDPPVWWWGRKAARLGAAVIEDPDAPGDVLLPGAGPAWVDGGPRSPFADRSVAGAVIVHRESVERGRLSVAPALRPPAADLAPDQLAAVAHGCGPARIIAPAGSGKTRVLTERLRHLCVDRGWEPDAVLAVAYNKKAQQELDERCGDFRPRTRTLNALGLGLLSRFRDRAPRVLDERETRRLVDTLAPPRPRRANTDPLGPYLEGLSLIRLGLVDPEEVEASRDDVPGLAALFPVYRAALAEQGAVDFDEQVYAAIELLLTDGDSRAQAQHGHRHLLV